MSNNSTLPATGDVIRDIDKSGVKTQVMLLDGGGSGAEALVSPTAGLPVSLNQVYYPSSTNNSTTAQLASGATFTGAVENILSLQAAQIEVVCDQPYLLTIYQYTDAGGTKLSSTDTFTRAANVPYNENVTLPGNFFKLSVQNLGLSTTTTLTVDVTFGIMATGPRTLTALGNNRTGITEVGGAAVGTTIPVSAPTALSVTDTNIAAALTDDAPLFTVESGDPNGDFGGVNPFEVLLDDHSGFAMNARVMNPVAIDLNRATILSDAPNPIRMVGQIGSAFIIDTTGYQSLNITTGAGFAGNVTISDDGILFSALTGVPKVLGAYVTAVAATTQFVFPCIGRYIKITLTAAGGAVAYLRNQPWPGTYTTSVPTAAPTAPTLNAVNLTQIGGTAQTAGGLALNSLASTNGQSMSQSIITATAAAVVQVKASAGRITMLFISNGAANAGYLHLQNNAAATTATASVMTIAIPATAGAAVPVKLPEGGLYFSAGIAYTVSGAIASADTTALTAPSIAVNISFI